MVRLPKFSHKLRGLVSPKYSHELVEAFAGLLAILAMVGACSKAPTDRQSCLLKAMENDSAKAISAAKTICEELFPPNIDASNVVLPTGKYYYSPGSKWRKEGSRKCSLLFIGGRGAISDYEPGFCYGGGGFEEHPPGNLMFTCKAYNSDENHVRLGNARILPKGVLIAWENSPEESFLHNTEVGCLKSLE